MLLGSCSNKQKIMGTWTDKENRAWVFNADGKLLYENRVNDMWEYNYYVTDTKLTFEIASNVQTYDIFISSDGKTLILTEGKKFQGWSVAGPGWAENRLIKKVDAKNETNVFNNIIANINEKWQKADNSKSTNNFGQRSRTIQTVTKTSSTSENKSNVTPNITHYEADPYYEIEPYYEPETYYEVEPYYEPEPCYYYGVDLAQFPPKIKDWIMYSAFTRERMESPHMINPSLRVWWGNDNNSVHADVTHIVAKGYVGEGQLKTDSHLSYRVSSLFETYGEYEKYQTLQFKWDQKQEVEKMLRNDPAFAEIINFAKKLCSEIEYDWKNFSGYRGTVKRTPNMRYAVCSGYADEVMAKALKLKSVNSVQLWNAPSHAWNVLKLIDGRTLYFDLTWFDNEHINHETGIIYQTEDYGWSNITFDEHLFRFSNVGYGTRVFTHNRGRFVKEIK
jgi:hypothetical protein